MIKSGENMLITNQIIKEKIKDVSNKDMKISRAVKNKKIFKLKNGLYETNSKTPGYLLAGSIYGPSYLSFDFALAFYGLIPEGVFNFTSATFGKKKRKEFINYFGTYIYRDVPKSVYSLGVLLLNENGYFYQIASKEKALCDKLYTLSPLKNKRELINVLFNDLRIDKIEFNKLDYESIKEIAKLYNSSNINLLVKCMKGLKNE